MNALDLFQYIFMGVVCVGGVIGMIVVILNERKK